MSLKPPVRQRVSTKMLNDKERHFVHISGGGDGGMSVTTQAVGESLLKEDRAGLRACQ